MNNSIVELQAEVKILSYKLDKIRAHINNRLEIVDPITKNELQAILGFISLYEIVPSDWEISEPLVNIPEGK